MGRRGIATFALAAALCAGLTAAVTASDAGEWQESATVDAGVPFAGFSVSPKQLPRRDRAPGELTFEAAIRGDSGAEPLGFRRVSWELDRHMDFDLAGREGTAVGRGTLEFETLAAVPGVGGRKATFTVYGGDVRGGSRRLRLAIDPRAGFDGNVLLELTRVPHGRIGYRLELVVPPAVDDRFRVTGLVLQLGTPRAADPGRRELVGARCSDGKIEVEARAESTDGFQLAEEELVRPCTPSG